MIVLAITNQKGGVGKTTTAINLAAALAMRGKRTLLIDLDPQANSSMSYLDLTTVEKSTYDVLMGEKTLSDIVRETQVQNLDLAPARISLAKAENKLIGELEGHFKLRDALDACKRKYDFIVIDTPPTLGIITANALVASSHVLVPVQSSYFALEGTEDVLETVEKIRARPNHDLILLGAVITMYDKRNNLSDMVAADVRGHLGEKVYETMIPRNVRISEAPSHGKPVLIYDLKCLGSQAYLNLAGEVMRRERGIAA